MCEFAFTPSALTATANPRGDGAAVLSDAEVLLLVVSESGRIDEADSAFLDSRKVVGDADGVYGVISGIEVRR